MAEQDLPEAAHDQIAEAIHHLALAEERLIDLFDQHNKSFERQYERFVAAEEERTALEQNRFDRDAEWHTEVEALIATRWQQEMQTRERNRSEDRQFSREQEQRAHDRVWGGIKDR